MVNMRQREQRAHRLIRQRQTHGVADEIDSAGAEVGRNDLRMQTFQEAAARSKLNQQSGMSHGSSIIHLALIPAPVAGLDERLGFDDMLLRVEPRDRAERMIAQDRIRQPVSKCAGQG